MGLTQELRATNILHEAWGAKEADLEGRLKQISRQEGLDNAEKRDWGENIVWAGNSLVLVFPGASCIPPLGFF